MSVVVRMGMPENCTCCPMCFTADVQGYHWCAALEQEVEEGLSRPKECPIICQLPEGHGRLVDADALADDVRSLWDYKTVDGITATTVLNQTLTDIRNCPTIVPAERSDT